MPIWIVAGSRALFTLPTLAADGENEVFGVASGSKTPNKDKVGKVTRKQILEIIKMKQKDLNVNSEEAAIRLISGTARSMGIEVVG